MLLHHAWVVGESVSGYIDLFFVMSGFLITTLIFEERRNHGTVSMRHFYGRRGLRLLPSLIVVLFIFWVPIALFARELLGEVTGESLATLFYVHNIFYSPLLGSFQYMGQMWSLSLEEQFYLIGALTTWWCLKRDWVRPLAVALGGFILYVWIARALGHGGPGQFWFQRPDAIALGVLLAIANAELPTELPERVMTWIRRAGWVALITFIFAIFSSSVLVERAGGPYWPMYPDEEVIGEVEIPDDASRTEALGIANQTIQEVLAEIPNGNYWVRWGFTMATASSAVLCLAFVRVRREDFALSRWMSTRFLTYSGVLSYAMYISHYQLFRLMDPDFTGGPKWILPKLLLAFLLGAALHKWIERPAMKYRYLFSRNPRPTT